MSDYRMRDQTGRWNTEDQELQNALQQISEMSHYRMRDQTGRWNKEDEELKSIRIATENALQKIDSRKKWVKLLRLIRTACIGFGQKRKEIVKIINKALVPAVTMDELYQAIRAIHAIATPEEPPARKPAPEPDEGAHARL